MSVLLTRYHFIRNANFIILCVLLMMVTGCAGVKPLTTEEQFVAEIDGMLNQLLMQQPASIDSMAPVSVMPGSLVRGTKYTRLEEYVVDRLTLLLRQSGEIYTPTRENWFEIRERQPLTFAGQPANKRSYLNELVVYQVNVSADQILKQVAVQVMAFDSQSKPVPGVLAETGFPIEAVSSPALLQFQASPKNNPIPEGLEERPFSSMDRLTYSLASELASAYRANISANQGAAADTEVKVVLQTRTINGTTGSGFLQQLESSLQQAFVAKKGFTCAVSQKDFAPVLDQINFYRNTRDLFEMDETLLSPGSVVLLAEAFPHQEAGKIGINLRSIWRITPLEDNQGQVLMNNLGGTYISGFAARAYLTTTANLLESGGSSPKPFNLRSPKDTRSYQPNRSRGFE